MQSRSPRNARAHLPGVKKRWQAWKAVMVDVLRVAGKQRQENLGVMTDISVREFLEQDRFDPAAGLRRLMPSAVNDSLRYLLANFVFYPNTLQRTSSSASTSNSHQTTAFSILSCSQTAT